MRLHHYTFQDYLRVEEMSAVRHEFLGGEIYAMAGGSILHAALAGAVLGAFDGQLAGRCRVFTSDLRVRVLATGLACYPDVTIVCGAPDSDPESNETVVNPTVVVEVLSPATMNYDLGEKFDHYRQIPSLRAVVYLWQDRRQIEVRTPDIDDGGWRAARFGTSSVAEVEALGCVLDVDAIYTRSGA